MKKLFYSILAAAAALFTVACHQETATRFEEGGLADVSFQVSLPGLQTKAFGDGTTADSLVVMVYKVSGGNYEYLPEVKPIPEDPEFDNLTATVNLKLVRGLSYRILFWAQNSYPGLYEINHEQGTVTMVLPQEGVPANDEKYDAFFVNWEGSVGNEAIQETVQLRRPFAQLNVIAPKADAEAAIANGITPGGSSMKVTAPTKLDLISGAVSENKEIEFFATPNDEPVNIPGYEAAQYDYIAMNYIFADADAALLNQLEFAVYEDGGNMIGDPFQLTNVPVCRNYRTVLIGNVFSVDATFEVTIISEFGGTDVVPLENAEDQSIVLDGTAGSLNGEPGIGSILIDDPQAPGSFNTTLQIGDKLDFAGVFTSNSGFGPHYSSTNEEVGKFAANPGDAESLFTAIAAGETQIKVHFNAVINGEEQTKAESKNFKSAEVIVNITVEAEPEPGDDAVYALFDGDIVEGDYVIVYGAYAMNNAVSNNRLQYGEVEIVNDAIVNPDASIVWHIAPNDDNWTIYSADAEKYAASNGTKNQAAVIADGTDAKAQWTIAKQAATDTAPVTYEIENVSNKAANPVVNYTLRNNGTYGFACYAKTTGGTLSLYKLVGGGAPVVVDQVAAPSFNYEAGEVQSGTEIIISCNTEGASIWYKIDNDVEWTLYESPIVVDAALTITAKATKSEMLDSDEVSVSYTVASQEQTFYNILIDEGMSNGTVTPEFEQAQAGDPVTLTIVPGDGMALVADSLKYTDEAGGNETVISFQEDTSAPVLTYTATLVMPAFNVIIYAEFDEPGEPGYVYTGSGTAADPYTVADVRHYIDELNGETSTDVVYVQGVITSLTNYMFAGGSTASFFIADSANSEDTFEAYKVQYIDKKTYVSSYPDVAVNDAVIVAGKVKLYSVSTYETTGDGDSFVYSLNGQTSVPPVVSALDINNVPAAGVTGATTTVALINADGWDVSVAPDGTVVTAASIDGTTITYSVAQNTSENGVEGYIGVTLSKQGEENVEKMIVVSQLGAGEVAPTASWEVVTDFSTIESGGKYIFVNVQSNKSYYMESTTCSVGKGTKCVELTKLPTDPEFVLEDKMYVVLTASNTEAGFIVSNSSGKQLYINNANNGLGFLDEGTVVNFYAVTKDNVTTGYTLTGKDSSEVTRYIGMNSTTNFRCYTSENNNVKTGSFVWYHYIGE